MFHSSRTSTAKADMLFSQCLDHEIVGIKPNPRKDRDSNDYGQQQTFEIQRKAFMCSQIALALIEAVLTIGK